MKQEELELVHQIASSVFHKIPRSSGVQKEELISEGYIALLDAACRHKPECGDFTAFARSRIYGAMLDALRKDDWVGRKARREYRRLGEVRKQLEHRLGRAASHKELAAAAEMTVQELQQLRTECHAGIVHSPDSEGDWLDTFAGEPQETLLSLVGSKKLSAAIALVLNEREQRVLRLYYYQEMTLMQIGTIMHVTESRVCQILQQAQHKLRKVLDR